MLQSSKILTRNPRIIFTNDFLIRSKHSNEGLKFNVLGVTSSKSGFHQTQVQEYSATEPLPLPSNIKDLTSFEKSNFSPQRHRDLNGSFISSSVSDVYDNHKEYISFGGDDRIECYDCSGTISLSSSMQTNVPFPFSSNGKPTHLNMPGGQWSQKEKYTSEDLNNTHPTNMQTSTGGSLPLSFKKGIKHFLFCQDFVSYSPNFWSNFNVIHFKNYSTSPKVEPMEKTSNEGVTVQATQLTRRQKLKAAVKDYGAVVIVFHVGISLISLGGCYLAIVSGADLSGVTSCWGINEGATTAGAAAQFVVAYAVHKALAPGRIAITLTAVPFIVKKLRKIGFLKTPSN